MGCFIDSKPLLNSCSIGKSLKPAGIVSKLYQNPSLVRPECIKTLLLPCLTVQPPQSFAFHLQLHLRVLLEHLRITLSKELGHPLICHAPALKRVAYVERRS